MVSTDRESAPFATSGSFIVAAGGSARAVAAAAAVAVQVATKSRPELAADSGRMLPACRVLKDGFFVSATDNDNTSGGDLAGDLPLARCVRVRSCAL